MITVREITVKRKSGNRLRKRRRFCVDFEAGGMGVWAGSISREPTFPHTDPQVKKILANTSLPPSYKFNAIHYDLLFAAVKQTRVPFLLTRGPKPDNLELSTKDIVPSNLQDIFKTLGVEFWHRKTLS
jgi:hypothetical protein